MPVPQQPGRIGFWMPRSDDPTTFDLDVQAVISNALANMRRMEEEVTLHTVIEYLREKGYIIIDPEIFDLPMEGDG